MNIGDTYTDRAGKNYKCITAGSTQGMPFNPTNIVNSKIVWGQAELYRIGGGEGDSIILWEGSEEPALNTYADINIRFPITNFSYILVYTKLKNKTASGYGRSCIFIYDAEDYGLDKLDSLILANSSTNITASISPIVKWDNSNPLVLSIGYTWSNDGFDKFNIVKVVGVY